MPSSSPVRRRPLAAGLAPFVLAASCLGLASCAPDSEELGRPVVDLKPPGLLAAGPTSGRELVLRFDEAVAPVAGSFSSQPEASLGALAQGERVVVRFGEAQSPGADYSLAGEVEDRHGNRTRFLLRFTGWNDRAPKMRISEVLPCRNSSATKPHRDFVELEVLEDGNLGGEELSWASSVKAATYRFPAVEVKRGDFVVLHLAPEGLPQEIDELGSDLAASGGIDATAGGRDFWHGGLALPDSSGAIALALRPGTPPLDGLFYADDGKSGPVAESELADLAKALAAAGAWPLAASSPAWEDGFPWGGSTARSICRSSGGAGKACWFVSGSGGQSPGAANGAAEPAGASLAAKRAAKDGKPPKGGRSAKARF